MISPSIREQMITAGAKAIWAQFASNYAHPADLPIDDTGYARRWHEMKPIGRQRFLKESEACLIAAGCLK